MGYKLKKVEICSCPGCAAGGVIKPNEERDLIIELEEENRAAIHGVVRFPGGGGVKNALVKLFLKKDHCDLVPISFAFTDECGQFLFGVDSGKEYVIKVFFYSREGPIIDIAERYIKEKFEPEVMEGQQPKVMITAPVDIEVSNVCKGEEEDYYNKKELYIEADISSIDVTNIKGQQERLNNSETLRLKEQDILEMDIVVRPPLHK